MRIFNMKHSLLKKLLTCLLAVTFVMTICGCSKRRDEDRPLIVCSIYPEYDWLINVLGDEKDRFDIKLILNGETDLHSYQPVASDIAAIIDCDVLIYVGGEADRWIDEALLCEGSKKDRTVINLLEVLGERVLDEEHVEGMQESIFGHHHKEDEDEHSHDEEPDEHVWLSVDNAIIFTKAIRDVLSSKYGELYDFGPNAETYISRLEELKGKYSDLALQIDDYIIVADRFPFAYLADSLGLKYYAAFSGCSSDSEANFRTVTFLADKLNESKHKNVFILENSDKRLANSIISAAGAGSGRIFVLDSMQSISSEGKKSGYSYVKAMEYNLSVLKEAFNK